MNNSEILNLQEAIKKKYDDLRDPEGKEFPALFYKSTKDPYYFLIKSIKLHVSQPNPTPSVKVLADFFHYKHPIKNISLLNTLYRYAFSKDRQRYLKDSGLIIDKASDEILIDNKSIEITIDYPVHGQQVDRIIKATGTIHNGSNLWLVVKPSVSFNHWVQQEPKIHSDGRWEAFIHVGSVDPGDIGIPYEIGAFVNPKDKLTVEQVLSDWPNASKASSIITVIRK